MRELPINWRRHIALRFIKFLTQKSGRATAQAVSRRPLTAEARVRSRGHPCAICGGQSGTGTGFSLVLRFSPVNFIPPVLHYKVKRKKVIIFITGLHNKPQGCGASVASAAGPFTTQKTHTHNFKNEGEETGTVTKEAYFMWILLIEGPRSRCYGCTAALRFIVQHCDEDDEVLSVFFILMEDRWNEIDRGKPKYSEKTCPSATLSTTNPTWPPRWEAGLYFMWWTFNQHIWTCHQQFLRHYSRSLSIHFLAVQNRLLSAEFPEKNLCHCLTYRKDKLRASMYTIFRIIEWQNSPKSILTPAPHNSTFLAVNPLRHCKYYI
jgi:hypothetical protein